MASSYSSDNLCDGCEEYSKLCLRNNRCKKNPDNVICEECGNVYDFSRLPPEFVRIKYEAREFWGAPCREPVPYGWICPSCTHYNDF